MIKPDNGSNISWHILPLHLMVFPAAQYVPARARCVFGPCTSQSAGLCESPLLDPAPHDGDSGALLKMNSRDKNVCGLLGDVRCIYAYMNVLVRIFVEIMCI